MLDVDFSLPKPIGELIGFVIELSIRKTSFLRFKLLSVYFFKPVKLYSHVAV